MAGEPYTISPVLDVGDGAGIQGKASAELKMNSRRGRVSVDRFGREPCTVRQLRAIKDPAGPVSGAD